MIDHTYLDSLTQLLGKDVINQIRLEYVEDSTQKIEQLLTAWDEKDHKILQEVSHSLKSASLNMAMHVLAEQCELIEQSASQSSDNGIQEVMDSLPTVHLASLKALEAYFLDYSRTIKATK